MPIICNNGTEPYGVDILNPPRCVTLLPGEEICVTAETAESLLACKDELGPKGIKIKKDFEGIDFENLNLDVRKFGTMKCLDQLPTGECVQYVLCIQEDVAGNLVPATFTHDMSAPYAPVNPITEAQKLIEFLQTACINVNVKNQISTELIETTLAEILAKVCKEVEISQDDLTKLCELKDCIEEMTVECTITKSCYSAYTENWTGYQINGVNTFVTTSNASEFYNAIANEYGYELEVTGGTFCFVGDNPVAVTAVVGPEGGPNALIPIRPSVTSTTEKGLRIQDKSNTIGKLCELIDLIKTQGSLIEGCLNGNCCVQISLPNNWSEIDTDCFNGGAASIPTVNGDLEGPIGISILPTGWAQVPFTSNVSEAQGSPRDTSDTTGLTGHNVGAGIAGNPSCGSTFVSSLYAPSKGFHEGMQQNYTGLTIGQKYYLPYNQTVLGQAGFTAQDGYYCLYVDDDLSTESVGPTATTTDTTGTNTNVVRSSGQVCFTATATSHDIFLMPKSDSGDVRMAIDCIGDLVGEEVIDYSACFGECFQIWKNGKPYTMQPGDTLDFCPCPVKEDPIITTKIGEVQAGCVEISTGLFVPGIEEEEIVCVDGVQTNINLIYKDLQGTVLTPLSFSTTIECDILFSGEVCKDGKKHYAVETSGEEATQAVFAYGPNGLTLTECSFEDLQSLGPCDRDCSCDIVRQVCFTSEATTGELLGTMAQPTVVTVDVPALGTTSIDFTYNQTGMTSQYTDGQSLSTFDPTTVGHVTTRAGNEYFTTNAPAPQCATYVVDFGSVRDLTALVIWNEESTGIGQKLDIYVGNTGTTLDTLVLAGYSPIRGSTIQGGYPGQIIAFGSVNQGRYITVKASCSNRASGVFAVGEFAGVEGDLQTVTTETIYTQILNKQQNFIQYCDAAGTIAFPGGIPTYCSEEMADFSNIESLLQQLVDKPTPGSSCDEPSFTKDCPPEVCPPPSIEIYCDTNGTKYVTVGHASEVCGTSGTFLADAYYATPSVQTPYEPVGVPQICDDATIKNSECVVDECGKRRSCVDIINVVNGNPVESQTCVEYVAPECPVEELREAVAREESKELIQKRAIKALGQVKSIKLTVATVNTQIIETVNEEGELPVPVGKTCPCPCGADKEMLDKLCEIRDILEELSDFDCEEDTCSGAFEFCGWDASTNDASFFDEGSAAITVNGTGTVTPRTGNSFTTKSQAYQDTIDYVNSLTGFTMTVVTDVAIGANGASPRFRISYDGPCDGATIELVNRSLSDRIFADFSADPTTAIYQDSNGDDIESTNGMKLVE